MAEKPGLLQRSLNTIRDTARGIVTGQGSGRAARLGQGARKSLQRAKGSFKNLKVALGFSAVDGFDDDVDDQRSRKRARTLIGHDDRVVYAEKTHHNGDINKTVAPEFRAQVAAGLAGANSMTTGSTIVGGGDSFEASNDESW